MTTEEFRSRCRAHGLRITPQREAIFSALQRSGKHPTAEQLHETIRKRFPNVSLDTVNRTLLTFAEIGLVQVVEGRGSPRRYDPNLHPHHHVHCVKCGRITDFEHGAFDSLDIPATIQEEFTIVGQKVVLDAICNRCR